MEIHKIVCIQGNSSMQLCGYFKDWNSIPVFVTNEGTDSRSALYKDGTSFFIISGQLINPMNERFVYNRLWHEVAHLFFRDVWKPWDIQYEYRADLIAAAATSRALTLSRLYSLKKSASDELSFQNINKRIDNLYSATNTYTKSATAYMLKCLKPVTVL